MTVKYRDQDIEMNSGKGAEDENFPVGSFLIRSDLRPYIADFYAFARAADDIADSGELDAEDKIRRLEAFEAVLTGQAEGLSKAEKLRKSLKDIGVPLKHGTDLLAAFKQDARKQRYASMEDLLGYCALSANPVGRFLLDLHGEDPALYPASDALCSSLQILNHLQDCGEDREALDRVYIPTDWLTEEGETLAVVDEAKLSPGFRKVMDRMLAVCDTLNQRAEALENRLQSRRLAAESGVILRLAKRLSVRLAKHDPLATRVALSKFDFARAGCAGLFAGLLPRVPRKVPA